MRLFIKIAWRNIVRNHRRTLISLAAIIFGLASIIVFFGFTDGFHAQWVENSVKLYAGHVVIYADDYYEGRNLNRNIKNAEYLEAAARKAGGLRAYTTRVHVHGLASTAENSVAVLIRGIDIEKEKAIAGFDRRMVKGEYLDQDASREILLGYGLASRLHANIGNKLVLMIQAADGSIGAELFRLKGIFRAGAVDLDKHLAVISIKDAQELAVINDRVTEVVLILDGPEYVQPVTGFLKREIGSNGFDVLPWNILLPQAREMIELSSVFMYVVLAIVLVVVSLGILNTMLMSIMERTREFGVMMALGTRPAQYSVAGNAGVIDPRSCRHHSRCNCRYCGQQLYFNRWFRSLGLVRGNGACVEPASGRIPVYRYIQRLPVCTCGVPYHTRGNDLSGYQGGTAGTGRGNAICLNPPWRVFVQSS